MGQAITKYLRGLGAGLPVLVLWVAPAAAQLGYPSPAPNASARSQACLRLESQLAAIDRGAAVDPARAEQIKRYEDAAAKQQAELDRLGQQSQRLGCQGSGFFALFSGQSPQCGPINNQIQQMRANLDRTLGEIQRLQGNSGEREGQRRGILVALGQNDCGPQYRQYATGGPGGFFEQLFGGGMHAPPGAPLAGTYRTLCVRTCDGYYFPISYSTVPGKFADDEQLCRRLCPATEVTLYSHRNPGEDVSRAVSQQRQAVHRPAQRVQLPQAVQRRLQLPGTRPILGRCAAARRRPDRRARRYRRHRGAREAAVAAALRPPGQADQARSEPAGAEEHGCGGRRAAAARRHRDRARGGREARGSAGQAQGARRRTERLPGAMTIR